MSPLPKRGFALAQETPHGAATDKLFDSAHLRASGTQQIEKLSGSILQYRAGSNSGQLLVDFQTITPVQIIPQVPTCRVSASTINLPLGNVFFPSSTPVGTTANEQAFNISLNRAGGNSATASQASNATGVAIQITRLDTPLKFGQNSAAAGNTNQWFAGSAVFGQGKLDIPLKARYLKTAAQVTPGKANGAATFTMSYQ
ncbi:fimbrial protein [Delftia lacustris]|uniref:fimbrial protein n=1 Tax=Delftia lacustris TaxID=558537 RepID=UPI00285D520B|nr:fimbrial protein [Delftia lacustris]MDR6730826.1 type 1 fimbria pilin [Delftia lacustris]